VCAVTDVRDSSALDAGMRVGLVAYGAIHLLFTFIAFQLSWTHSSTSSQGAINQLADNVLGQLVLWVAAAGLALLAVWQGASAVAGYSYREGGARTRKRVGSGGRAVVYLALAWLAVSNAAGLSGSSGENGITAKLMSAPAGQWLVGLIGVAVLAVGGAQVRKGVQKTFTEDLEPGATSGSSGHALLRLGQAGYVAKGVSLAVVGGLIVWAAWTYSPKEAGGLDTALRTLLEQPFGTYLLSAVGLGLASFGVFCFGWARHPRT
jgi:hypothetical protein